MGLADDLQETKSDLYQNLLDEFDEVRQTRPGKFFNSYWQSLDEYEQELIRIHDEDLADRIETYADDIQHRQDCLRAVAQHDATLNDYLSDEYTFSDDGIKLRDQGMSGKFLDTDDLVVEFGDAVANASDPEDFYQRLQGTEAFDTYFRKWEQEYQGWHEDLYRGIEALDEPDPTTAVEKSNMLLVEIRDQADALEDEIRERMEQELGEDLEPVDPLSDIGDLPHAS